LAVVVHRRRTDDLYKDTDDIRENIINYEDEGGGEGDMTGYVLNVLRLMYDSSGQPMLGKEPVKAPLVGRGGKFAKCEILFLSLCPMRFYVHGPKKTNWNGSWAQSLQW
jgi:hypothetical protein